MFSINSYDDIPKLKLSFRRHSFDTPATKTPLFSKKQNDLHVYKHCKSHFANLSLHNFGGIDILHHFRLFVFLPPSIHVYIVKLRAIKFTTFAGPIETVTSIKSPDSFVPPQLEHTALILRHSWFCYIIWQTYVNK